jgi:predicted dehydrogenase
MEMSKDCNILIVGSGNMASRHVGFVLSVLPNAKIFGYSQTGGNLKNIDMLSNIEEIKKINFLFAIISNAAPFHCKIASLLLPLPLLVEKPISDNWAEAVKFHNLAKKYEAKVSVGYHLHHKQSFEFVKNILSTKKIGQIKLVKSSVGHNLSLWRPSDYRKSVSASKELGGGVLLELSHDIDYLRTLFGMPKQILCKSYNSHLLNIDKDVEDVALCIFDYGNFCVELQLDMIQTFPIRTCNIIGSEGSIEWDIRNEEVRFLNISTKKVQINKFIQDEIIYHTQLIEFISWINGNKDAKIVSLADAINTLKIVILAKESNYKNKFIALGWRASH